jgi:hypothetical protein
MVVTMVVTIIAKVTPTKAVPIPSSVLTSKSSCAPKSIAADPSLSAEQRNHGLFPFGSPPHENDVAGSAVKASVSIGQI